MSQLHRYNFQYFDQESDFGIETDDGNVVRKRKRPGRKANPPSKQERREQNRAAQKAFREREQLRQQAREAECQAHVKELMMLREKLKQVQYEADYLRGWVLLLCLVSLTERGSVPHVYSESRLFPIPILPYQFGPGDHLGSTPSILRQILQPDTHQLLGFSSAVAQAKANGTIFPYEQDNGSAAQLLPLNKDSQDVRLRFPRSQPKTTSKESAAPEPTLAVKPKRRREKSTSEVVPQNTDVSPSNPSELMLRSTTATQPVYGTITEVPTLKTPDDLVGMTSSQALHILRLQLRCASIFGDSTRLAFAPTALQRLIPHDVRIDYVPEPSMRDRMILFQGFYDADEMFQQLSGQSLFIGGDVRNERNWVMPPSFSEKYWFLSHEVVELRQRFRAIADISSLMVPFELDSDNNEHDEQQPNSSSATDGSVVNDGETSPVAITIQPSEYGPELTPS